MISFNHAAYIRQAIESILAQDIDFVLELVIDDDSITDGTRAICEAYVRCNVRVRLLSYEKNLGVMCNCVRTLQAGSGQHTAVCEGDDYSTDVRKLSKQISFLSGHQDYAGSTHQFEVTIDNVVVCH